MYFNIYNVSKSYVQFFLKIVKQKLWQNCVAPVSPM